MPLVITYRPTVWYHARCRLAVTALYEFSASYLRCCRFGEPWPMYINVVRDPVERIVSFFYYMNFGETGCRTCHRKTHLVCKTFIIYIIYKKKNRLKVTKGIQAKLLPLL